MKRYIEREYMGRASIDIYTEREKMKERKKEQEKACGSVTERKKEREKREVEVETKFLSLITFYEIINLSTCSFQLDPKTVF
jgi:hypothetical protein